MLRRRLDCFTSRLIAGLSMGLLQVTVSAAVSYEPPEGMTPPKITVTGEISRNDVAAFKKLSEVATGSALDKNILGEPIYWVDLNSNGGSVAAAMQIGRTIRSTGAEVLVTPNSVCVSACVLILAAGKLRHVLPDARVGIHRPFLSEDENLTVKGQKASYEDLDKRVKKYLKDMNIPVVLYDRMFRIPPDKMQFLSSTELQEYNLNENDPYFQEALDARVAKSLGLSKSAFLQLKVERMQCLKTNREIERGRCLTKLGEKYGVDFE